MDILISGGTGFIGSALCDYLLKAGHRIVVKTRRADLSNKQVTYINALDQLEPTWKFDVVINLAGEPIANKRWSEHQKKKILQSRIESTQELIDFFLKPEQRPEVFISGSAIGYYGVGTTNEEIDENSPGDSSFSSRLCAEWEACALQAEAFGIRTCLLRTGIVLGKSGGALSKMLPPFKLGLGGKIGTGTQWMPWIHLSDMISIVDYCITQPEISGPINCTAPNPVTNEMFSTALGKTLNRPTILPMPAVAIKLLMGQMGQELLLSGKKVLPKKLNAAGFAFRFDRVEHALTDFLSNNSA